jgi:hypothetical protein
MLAEAPPGDDLKAGLSFRSMGLGRVEPKAAGDQLPTSRLTPETFGGIETIRTCRYALQPSFQILWG